jgi:AcrR family transcriptional regulator
MYDVARANPPHPGRGRTGTRRMADEITDRVVEKVEQKVAAKLAKQADKLDRKLDGDALERLAAHLDALDVWTRGDRASRKPRYSREDIAATAVRICDTEGIDALSMRRLAQELGAGTMTLYHYVQTKDEVLTLVSDAVMAEVLVPDDHPLPRDWRAAVTVIAERTKACLQRHPWLFDITDDPPIGPNQVRHFDQTLAAVASLDLPLRDRLDIVTMVDEYTFGHCLHARQNVRPEHPGEGHFTEGMAAYLADLLATGEYPELQRLADDIGIAEALAVVDEHGRDEGRFRRGLDRLLDGIEADLRLRRRR